MCRSSGTPQPEAKGDGKKGKGGKRTGAAKTCWNCGESGHLSPSVPRRWSMRWKSLPQRVKQVESVDIEIDSGAEVSCLPSNIGADTHQTHETRLALRRVAANGMSSVPEFWGWKLVTCEVML